MLAARLTLLVMAAWTMAGCVSQTVKSTEVPPVRSAAVAVPEELLLDAGIVIFDPGLEGTEKTRYIYPEVRRAEARFMPRLLAEAMENSASWGAVRVVPDDKQMVDVIITGKILQSDGETLELAIMARDSSGTVWLQRDYRGQASRYAYDNTRRAQLDPFQAVYNRIANDLLAAQEQLSAARRGELRTISELRFARSFAPDAFDGYLQQNRRGVYQLTRLPAEDDPMILRIRTIRERDHLYIDTLQEYYRSFSGQMGEPYLEWRKQTYQEAIALRELRAQSNRRLLAGAIGVIGGIAAMGSDSRTTRAAGQVGVISGGMLIKDGLDKRSEAAIHAGALEEIGASLEAEISPQMIELEDRTVVLSGNVEDQYEQWRELLGRIYRAEVGELRDLSIDTQAAAQQR